MAYNWPMLAPILATKLFIPPPRPNAVTRPRLLARLNDAFQRKLTLISAPAGFGKTTLLSEWIAECGLPKTDGKPAANPPPIRHPQFPSRPSKFAWLSLDEGDADPNRFLAYTVAALQTVAPELGAGVLAALQAPQAAPTAALVTMLLNDLATRPGHLILVLDDYHVIDAQAVDDTLAFLVEHSPPQLHLVLATREDPQLPLPRLRARGQLVELRAADLRFTPAEAADFLNLGMGLALSETDVAALEARTEGWIAGLQMAAISMQGRADTTDFIRAFTGSHRFVLDYLVEEVLQRQPESLRRFLLQTSILARLSSPLCEAVTGQKKGKAQLDALERGNLFIIPLDDQRQWYRYHHLFAEVLRAHLLEAQPDQVAALHQRASGWYEQNALPAEAIRHALAAEDFDRAAGLMELAWSGMDISYQSATWLGWAKALPDALVRARPVLSVGYAWAQLDAGELEASETRLQDAERWLPPADNLSGQSEMPSATMVVVDEAQFRSLPATIATARAYRALALGDVPGTVTHAHRALAVAPADDHVRRIQATALLGLAYWASGALEAADQAYADLIGEMILTGNIPDAVGMAFVLAEIRLALGQVHAAVSAYEQALQLAVTQSASKPIGMADLYRGLSELCCERGDLEAAAQHLLTSQKLGEQAATTDWQHRLGVAEARLKQAQGDLEGALERLNEAERQYIRGPLPDVRPIAALKARVWLRLGRLTEALGWAQKQNLSTEDDLSYLREFEHITLARVLIAQYQRDQVQSALQAALGLLERLLHAAEAGHRQGSVIDILVAQALAHQAQGNTVLALVPLAHALALAEPEGYVRIFVDEGEPMQMLILDFRVQIEKQGRDHPPLGYVNKLLTAFPQAKISPPPSALPNPPAPAGEPLSERELEVLCLLGTELSGPEIARKLVVSLSTLRTHTQNIYTKLGVNHRRAAVRRAEELGLL
jgi:LuxR family transcriptional regulator, maltose regulon positive regulatory protein